MVLYFQTAFSGPQKPDLKIKSNMQKELEDYMQLASHELKGPLRKARTFGDLLATRAARNLDEESVGYLERMLKNLDLMQSLLDRLTDYSMFEIGNIDERCDLNKILEEAESSLITLPTEEKPEYKNDLLPVISGNGSALKKVFISLIDNSIKFQSGERKLKIEVTAEEITEKEKLENGLQSKIKYSKIVFADNGIGLPEEDIESIFKPFVRLNGKSAYKGNGFGLALCKKIVEAHNGIIYASPNKSGCCITLILPLSGQ